MRENFFCGVVVVVVPGLGDGVETCDDIGKRLRPHGLWARLKGGKDLQCGVRGVQGPSDELGTGKASGGMVPVRRMGGEEGVGQVSR